MQPGFPDRIGPDTEGRLRCGLGQGVDLLLVVAAATSSDTHAARLDPKGARAVEAGGNTAGAPAPERPVRGAAAAAGRPGIVEDVEFRLPAASAAPAAT